MAIQNTLDNRELSCRCEVLIGMPSPDRPGSHLIQRPLLPIIELFMDGKHYERR